MRSYSKGQEIETIVLAVDPERERISLGIKQLEKDPFSNFVAETSKGSIVKGKIIEVDAKGAKIELGEDIEGYLRASELANDKVEDARSVLKVGDDIEAKYIGVDRKNRVISLSIKAKDNEEEADAIKEYSQSSAESEGMTSLGDLMKEQMNSKE